MIEDGLTRLLARQEITEMISIWCQANDDCDFDRLGDLLADDARVVALGAVREGREAIIRSIVESKDAGRRLGTTSRHVAVNSVVDVSDTSATAVSDLFLFVWSMQEERWTLQTTGRYVDQLRKTDRWRFIERMIVPWKDTPPTPQFNPN